MADPLSYASGATAFVSLAIQLAEGVKKLCDFCHAVREAPKEIQVMIADLELLQGIFGEIAAQAQHAKPDATLTALLQRCNSLVEALTPTLKKTELCFASARMQSRNWAAIKVVWKDEERKQFRNTLEGLKTTMLLVRDIQNSRLNRARHETLEKTLKTITEGIFGVTMQRSSGAVMTTGDTLLDSCYRTEAFRTEHHSRTGDTKSSIHRSESWKESGKAGREILPASSPRVMSERFHGPPKQVRQSRQTVEQYDSLIDLFFGTVYIQSQTSLLQFSEMDVQFKLSQLDQYEHKSSVRVRPAMWLVKLGLNHAFQCGMETTLETFRPVPDDALIFEFCTEGDVSGVRDLLSRGTASVRDTDSQGRTALHFAAGSHHPELCNLLIKAGAEKDSYTYFSTPLRIASRNHLTTSACLQDVMDTLRLFWDCMDLSEKDGDGWEVILDILGPAMFLIRENNSRATLLTWILRLANVDIKENSFEERYYSLVRWSCASQFEDDINLVLEVCGDRAIDSRKNPAGYSELLCQVALDESDIRIVLGYGPNLHMSGRDTYYSPYIETPTSLAMYSSWAFANWCDGLNDIGVDPKEFIDMEMQQTVLAAAGWKIETLLALFEYEFEVFKPFSMQPLLCDDCLKWIALKVQPYWLQLLERIKCGLINNSTSEHECGLKKDVDDLLELSHLVNERNYETGIKVGEGQEALCKAASLSESPEKSSL